MTMLTPVKWEAASSWKSANRSGMERLEAQLGGFFVIKEGEDKVLICNQRLDASAVR